MGKKEFDQLKGFISEALQAVEAAKIPAKSEDPIDAGPGWPQAGEEKFSFLVMAELSTVEKSQRELIRRLKTISYPYKGNETDNLSYTLPSSKSKKQKPKTFYQHVKTNRILDLLLNPPLLWDIRRAWFLSRYCDLEKNAKGKGLSQHGYALKFHREMMLELSHHLQRLSTIAKKYQQAHAISEIWGADYRRAIQRHLIREASAYFPQLLRRLKPGSQIRPHSFEVDEQVDLFDAIELALAKREITNHKLAFQLTALFCSPLESILKHKLDPTPELVRRNVRDRKKKE